jgi:hypothetical protein
MLQSSGAAILSKQPRKFCCPSLQEMLLNIDLSKLNYLFQTKPLLVGGKAMAYYQLRKSGPDIDFVVRATDYERLANLYPENTKALFGDLGVCVHEFEFWKCTVLFDYEFLSIGALEQEPFKIVSLEKLLFLKALAISEIKYEQDVRLIVEKIQDIQYGKDTTYDRSYFQR